MFLVFLLILLEILQYRKLYLISFPSHSTSFFHLSSRAHPSLPAEMILVHLGMQSRHALTLWCIWQMHNRPPTSISIVSLDKPGDQALIDWCTWRHVLLDDCKNDLPSTMGNSVGAFFKLQVVPPMGWCHLFTNEQWHPVSAEAETRTAGEFLHGVNEALPLALQSWRQKSSSRGTPQSTGMLWIGSVLPWLF